MELPQASRRQDFLVGLIGDGIKKSRTPAMHESEGKVHSLNYTYQLIDTKEDLQSDLPAILDQTRLTGFAGVNVTHPHKQLVLEHVDWQSKDVQRIGATNTIVFRETGFAAYNTDYLGFAHAFREELGDEAKDRVLLVGAGGGGGAVGHALADNGVKHLVICDVNLAAARKLAERISDHNPGICLEVIASPADTAGKFDGVANATPIGMASHPGVPLPTALLEARPWVADIVYFPLETELLRIARRMGCHVMSGRTMAIMQAAFAFQLFTGRQADPKRMGRTFDRVGITEQ